MGSGSRTGSVSACRLPEVLPAARSELDGTDFDLGPGEVREAPTDHRKIGLGRPADNKLAVNAQLLLVLGGKLFELSDSAVPGLRTGWACDVHEHTQTADVADLAGRHLERRWGNIRGAGQLHGRIDGRCYPLTPGVPVALPILVGRRDKSPC